MRLRAKHQKEEVIMFKSIFLIAVCLGIVTPFAAAEKLMQANLEDSAMHRWLNKEVYESRLLDDMEDITMWSLQNKVDEIGQGSISLTQQRYKDGSHSLRLNLKTRSNEFLGVRGRPFGITAATRRFNSEDWSNYNRISFWVWPDFPRHRIISLMISLENDGKQPGQPLNEVYPLTTNFVLLKNNEWNHVVWEISDIQRNKVTAISFVHRLQGNEPEASDTVSFDIDHLELQRVQPDYSQGWLVAPGRISFSHTGYQVGLPKKAFASRLNAKDFKLINLQTGETVFSKSIETVKTNIGEFQIMDFSEFDQSGSYVIRAGDIITRPFSISENVWEPTIWKGINFFYGERCGMEIPGVHRVCHRDWYVFHKDKKIIMNGGWHDAGDLSQISVRTSEAVHAMFNLAEKLHQRGESEKLAQRLIEEAKWGLDWVLKTSFRDGYRVNYGLLGIWTDGIIGNADDAFNEAVNDPYGHLHAALAEAAAFRVLKKTEPDLAAYSLKMAEEDWLFAMTGINKPLSDYDNCLDLTSMGILVSLDLFKATGKNQYAEKAVELAQTILDSQEKTFLPALNVPVTGFFYENPRKDRLRHQDGMWFWENEHTPITAMVQLCEVFPNHPDWMKWYSAVALHSQYCQKELSKLTQPYGVLPFSIYKTDEYLHFREIEYLLQGGAKEDLENQREIFRQQVLNGFKIGDEYYVRVFAVQPSFYVRASYPAVLSQAKAVSIAAHLRGNLELAALCEQQLQWIVGRNPFAQSTMYGEGYDFRPQYAAMSGDLVGALPCGFKFCDNNDIPYWPASNCFHYTEMFIQPVYRWFSIMCDIAGQAIVDGLADKTVKFENIKTKKITQVVPDSRSGTFRVKLPAGVYKVFADRQQRTITLLPAQNFRLDLRPDDWLDFSISHKTSSDGKVVITLTAQGNGKHSFELRMENLTCSETKQDVKLKAGAIQTVTWQCQMKSTNTPWFAVIVPDNDLTQCKEAMGDLWRKIRD